jgi:hypothetical protein
MLDSGQSELSVASHLPISRTPVQVLDALSEDYRHAFETFPASTDQKKAALYYLTALVGRLPKGRVFIDAGAGEGGHRGSNMGL